MLVHCSTCDEIFWAVFVPSTICYDRRVCVWGSGCHCFWEGEREWCIWVTLNDTGFLPLLCGYFVHSDLHLLWPYTSAHAQTKPKVIYSEQLGFTRLLPLPDCWNLNFMFFALPPTTHRTSYTLHDDEIFIGNCVFGLLLTLFRTNEFRFHQFSK